MPRLLDLQDAFDPRDHFMRAGIGRLVQIDEPSSHVIRELPVPRGASFRKRSEMVRADVHLVQILIWKKKRACQVSSLTQL